MRERVLTWYKGGRKIQKINQKWLFRGTYSTFLHNFWFREKKWKCLPKQLKQIVGWLCKVDASAHVLVSEGENFQETEEGENLGSYSGIRYWVPSNEVGASGDHLGRKRVGVGHFYVWGVQSSWRLEPEWSDNRRKDRCLSWDGCLHFIFNIISHLEIVNWSVGKAV